MIFRCWTCANSASCSIWVLTLHLNVVQYQVRITGFGLFAALPRFHYGVWWLLGAHIICAMPLFSSLQLKTDAISSTCALSPFPGGCSVVELGGVLAIEMSLPERSSWLRVCWAEALVMAPVANQLIVLASSLPRQCGLFVHLSIYVWPNSPAPLGLVPSFWDLQDYLGQRTPWTRIGFWLRGQHPWFEAHQGTV